MPPAAKPTPPTVALIGNPNTGKSTLFSALVGVRQHVANYPGVTVEKKTGRLRHAGRQYELIDLPGLYSLAPRARNEMVAVEVLLGRRHDCPPVDAVLCIADGSNLERSFYLVSQVLELGLPAVLAVNMVDVAARRGIKLRLDRLEERLGIAVVAVQANRKVGVERLKAALARAVGGPAREQESLFPAVFEEEVTRLESLLTFGRTDFSPSCKAPRLLPRCLVRRLLLDSSGYLQASLFPGGNGAVAVQLEAARRRLAQHDCPMPGIEATVRHEWARRTLEGVVSGPSRDRPTASDRIDRLLTHRIWGTLVFALVMLAMFQAVFTWAQPAKQLIDDACGLLGAWIEAHLAKGALSSLLVDGVIGGVGGVLSFLPQILVLFCFIGVLEDCGYMARAACLMDRLMARVGLSGKSFIPMLSCFACAVPGIMATRVIENERDRLTTILAAPLLTCSARLPVYALLIAAFIPEQVCLGGLLNLQGLTLGGLYALGIAAAVSVALALRRTVLWGAAAPFFLELPSYKWPSARTILYRVAERGWVFLRSAGTLILAVSILVWAMLYYPHDASTADAQNRSAGEHLRQSILGRIGRVIEPIVKPLGWDWRIGCAVLASLPARELVVANMGVIYNVGSDGDAASAADSARLRERLRSAAWEGSGEPVFNVPVALSIMVFYALCAQCVATLAVIRRETNGWRWPAFTFTYMTALAYLGALVTYQVGMWLST